MVSVANHHIYIKMIVDGIVTPPFSAITLPPLNTRAGEGNKEKIIALSRSKYAVPRDVVENNILQWQAKMAELSSKPGKLECQRVVRKLMRWGIAGTLLLR